jgi:hypothetical protein
MDELHRYTITFVHQGKPVSWSGLMTNYWGEVHSNALSKLNQHGVISGLRVRKSAPVAQKSDESSLWDLIQTLGDTTP